MSKYGLQNGAFAQNEHQYGLKQWIKNETIQSGHTDGLSYIKTRITYEPQKQTKTNDQLASVCICYIGYRTCLFYFFHSTAFLKKMYYTFVLLCNSIIWYINHEEINLGRRMNDTCILSINTPLGPGTTFSKMIQLYNWASLNQIYTADLHSQIQCNYLQII